MSSLPVSLGFKRNPEDDTYQITVTPINASKELVSLRSKPFTLNYPNLVNAIWTSCNKAKGWGLEVIQLNLQHLYDKIVEREQQE